MKTTTSKIIPLCLLAVPFSIFAATVTWDGGGVDSNWKTADNWDRVDYPGLTLTNDDALISLNAANVTLSGGLTNQLGSLTVRNTVSTDVTALTITSGTVNIGTSGATNPNLRVGGVGTNTLTIDSTGVVNVSSGGGRIVWVGDRSQLGSGLLHINGGTFDSNAPVNMAGRSANSALKISGAATVSFDGGLAIDGNGGSTHGNLILEGNQFTATAASFTTQFTSTADSVYGISFVADASGLGVLAVTNNITFQNGGTTDATNLAVDLSSFSYGLNTAYTLFSYGGSLTGAFTSINVTGLGVGETALIDYGLGTNDAITLTVIPEPSTLALFGLAGVAGVMGMRRRRG